MGSKPTEGELRARLTPEQYRVTQEQGAERAFCGVYCDSKHDGMYLCADKAGVAEITDRSHGMSRTEVRCARSGAHLGHVFGDGPQPTGQRFCINSAALGFKPGSGF